ncbi:Ophiophagus venom factor [Dirofilaria immitis]
MAMILLICVFLLMNLQQIEQKPLLMSQSRLRWNATNEVLIAARSSINNLVDISMEIYAYPSSLLIFRQTLQAKVAGSLNRVKFFVPGGKTRSDSYRLVVRVQNDSESLERIILGAPDLRSIYLQTDKTVYKPTDIVKVRALPLTTSGKLYDGPVDFALVNPDGFELIHKNRSTSNNRFIAVEFQLPDHLAFGEWKILARPDRQKPYTYSLTFQVYKYELSPFIVHVLAKETGDFDLYEIDILARYANGQRVSGQVSIWCNCNANNSAATSSNSEKSFLCVLKSSKILLFRNNYSAGGFIIFEPEQRAIIACIMLKCFFAQSSSNSTDNDNKDCNLFRKTSDFTAISSKTNTSTMGTNTRTIVDAISIPILNLNEDRTDENIPDLIFTLGQTQGLGDISTAIESSFSTVATCIGGFFSQNCTSSVSVFSSGNDDDNENDDDSSDENHADYEDDKEPTPSTSGNYLHEWTPQYSSSLSIFATLSSGNFLSESEITQIFSRYGNIKEVKWIQISENNGYIIVFTNENEKENAIKVCGNKMETKGRVLKLWSFKQANLFVDRNLAIIDTANHASHQLTTDKDDGDPYSIADAKLLGLANSFQSNVNNDIIKHQIYYHPNTRMMTLKENMPSPERPGTRPSPVTAFLLKQISGANMFETGQFYEKISCNSGSEKNRFLNLPAPYHLLPDTPYFRRAPIVPPPTRSLSAIEQIPIQQRIINRYLASMKMDDEKGFAAIAKYERECYEHLYVTSYYPTTVLSEQQKYGRSGVRRFQKGTGRTEAGFDAESRLDMNVEKHILSANFFSPSTVEEQKLTCINLGSTMNSAWSTLLVPSNQQNYEVWNMTHCHWSGRINIIQCGRSGLTAPSINLVKLTAEVLDHGTGNRVKNNVKIDNNLAGFELIPLRPGYYRDSSNILILIKSMDGSLMRSQEVEVDVRCISTDKNQTLNLRNFKGRIGFFLNIPFSSSLYEHNCRVILIQARRKIGKRFSHPVTLVLPSVDHSKYLQYGWIQQSLHNNATYRVGEKFRASVPLHLASKLNYLVVCQDEIITEAGRVRDDGEIIFEITDVMLSFCALYVFSANVTVQIDMIWFFVELSCKNSLAISKTSVGVNDNLTITISGGSNGLALLSAIDIRMLELMQKYSSHPIRDLSVAERSLRTLFFDLIDSKNLSDEIKGICEEAGVLMLQHLKRCPNFMESSSIVTNLCLRSFILACERLTGQTTTSEVCDRKTQRDCGVNRDFSRVKLASAHLQLMRADFRPHNRSFDDSVFALFRRKTDLNPIVRQYFPEVWLFEDYSLGVSGRLNVTTRVPDAITQWSFQSLVWTPGDLAICQSDSSIITAQQKFFLTVDLPQHVYINESITARVSVFAEQIEKDMLLSVCMTKLDRHVCGDVGAYGERGQPAYTRIHLTTTIPTSVRIFAFRFLRLGETEVVFILKEEISYPGRYHCDIGEIYDAVKLKVTVGKRAETMEHFKRLVLNPRKPIDHLVRTVNEHDSMMENETKNGNKNIIDYDEYRSEREPLKLFTNVSINLPETESIYSIIIDLSQFLPDGLIADPIQNEIQSNYRWKRSVLGYESFLTDIINSFAPILYQFKSFNSFDKKAFREFESLDDTIGSLISAMLTFSNCHGIISQSCAFSNYRNPRQSHEESFLLTALSTSLLCEANADERIVCPLLTYLLKKTATDMDTRFPIDYFLDLMDLITIEDKYWFTKAMVNQLSSDCIVYHCARNDRIWINLRKSFFNLSDRTTLDIRTVAALAFMAPRSVSSIMRIKLYSTAKDGVLPYWTTKKMSNNDSLLAKRSGFDDYMKRRIVMSGDLFVNSLGLLAFVSRKVDPMLPLIELDLLADWIYEQLNEDGQTPSALDAYFANRAIYEYRLHKINRQNSNDDRIVTVLCKQCKLTTHNVTVIPTVFHLPVTVRNITLITEGDAKVRTRIRVLTTKRMRLRRALEQNDLYPTKITVIQNMVSPGIIQQEVCLKILISQIESLEVTHGLFTGFTSRDSFFKILQNTSIHGVRLLDDITFSNYAIHFVLIGLKTKIPLCYELKITEPRYIYEPNQLAPVAITVRHPLYDVIGQELITYTERFKRSILEETIDIVCWDGSCSCAEASCTVRCSQCKSITKEHLQHELCSENTFAATVEVESYRTENFNDSVYFIIEVSPKHWKQNNMKTVLQKPDRIELWLRTCNIRCAEPKIRETYYFSGNINGIVVDFNTRMHYVLRDDDRWELANEECGHLFSYLITSRPCIL